MKTCAIIKAKTNTILIRSSSVNCSRGCGGSSSSGIIIGLHDLYSATLATLPTLYVPLVMNGCFLSISINNKDKTAAGRQDT